MDGVVHVVLADRDEALHWFRQEESAVGPAVRSLDDPRLLRLRGNCAREWIGYNEVVGRWSEEIGTARVGLEAGLALDDPVATVRSRSNLTRALLETGHTEEVEASIDAMLADLHRLPPEVRARIECEIGFFRIRQGRFTEALLHPRRALEIYRGIGRSDGVASTLSNVGWVLAHLGVRGGHRHPARRHCRCCGRWGDRRFEAGAWDAIGRAQQGLGRLDAAITGYRTALRLFEELLDDYNRAGVLDHLASAQLEQGQEAEARARTGSVPPSC
ncbi:hypothetical protein [Streptomyces sp. KL116D]|uniref:hypothetical protein n=1 Tax=Streptomyces sp. KL116D TaxID=3045152 RepID=UPI003556D5F3